MELQWRPVDALLPYARNARTHSDAQLDQITSSMIEFGFTNPVLIDACGAIIAGHGRVLSAERAWKAGKEIPRCPSGTVPCIALEHLTDAQRRAYALADNKLAQNAGWDDMLLSEELRSLDADGFTLGVIGFSEQELSGLLLERLPPGETDHSAEWRGMPEFNQPDASGLRVIVHFESEDALRRFEELVEQPISRETQSPSIWYPKKDRQAPGAKRYE
jgi:hypothetical protein